MSLYTLEIINCPNIPYTPLCLHPLANFGDDIHMYIGTTRRRVERVHIYIDVSNTDNWFWFRMFCFCLFVLFTYLRLCVELVFCWCFRRWNHYTILECFAYRVNRMWRLGRGRRIERTMAFSIDMGTLNVKLEDFLFEHEISFKTSKMTRSYLYHISSCRETTIQIAALSLRNYNLCH